jgi:hypothetical protein
MTDRDAALQAGIWGVLARVDMSSSLGTLGMSPWAVGVSELSFGIAFRTAIPD